MAESYPLDLSALKRAIDTAELMTLNVDLTDKTIEQSLITLKDAIIAAQILYNSNAEINKNEFNTLIDRVQSIGNDLKDKINALNVASGDNLQALADQLTALKTLLEGDAGVTIINTLDVIADEVNSRLATLVFPATISDNTGKATIDISALGLASSSDYNVTVTQNATAGFAFVHYAPAKVDEKTIEIVAYDAKYTPESGKLYDGTDVPANFTATVHFVRPAISVAITETDGDTATVGN